MNTAKQFRNYHLNHAKKWTTTHPDAKEPKPCFDYWLAMRDPEARVLFKKNNRNDGAVRIFIKELTTIAENHPGEWVQKGDTYVMSTIVNYTYVWTMHNNDMVAVLTKPCNKNHIVSFFNASIGSLISFNEYVELYKDIVGGEF